ncbi:MAG: hypothetical protein HGA39_01715 [Coriobacteriia bacterium]|nr:hypothetical protein [Coriobacteriia bacterium]
MSTTLTWRDTAKRWALRWGVGRETSAVRPGLYAIGEPGPASPVLVTANYRMTVDIVRRDLAGCDVWLLVLDTLGINVWCAAGKGTFGTRELVSRILAEKLDGVVEHRVVVVPQLGAPGVNGREVQRLSGFRVIWGPVYSRDLPEYLRVGMRATAEMRKVRFPMADRLALAPVELVGSLPWIWVVGVLMVLAFVGASLGAHRLMPSALLTAFLPSAGVFALGVLAGGLAVPALLPWLPGRAFSVKGAVAGVAVATVAMGVALAFGVESWLAWPAVILGVGAIASYVGVNFTGATPFTSPSGVERELRRAIPWQVAAAGVALVLWTAAWATGMGA